MLILLSLCAAVGYTIPSFSGGSVLQLKKLDRINRDITIEMQFQARKPDGLLLYTAQSNIGKGDFLALTLRNGHVEFRYNNSTYLQFYWMMFPKSCKSSGFCISSKLCKLYIYIYIYIYIVFCRTSCVTFHLFVS